MLATGFSRLPIWMVGAWILTLAAAPAVPAAAPLSDSRPEQPVDFERHVMGLLSRMGCNAGSCHGSFQGKGGFRLSLFGYDPAKDHAALTREGLGRRISTVDPDRSLLLLKATGQTDHGGGRRFDRNSWQYRLLRDWIRQGARWTKGSGDLAALAIHPAPDTLIPPGNSVQVRVQARFTDGVGEDVTALCDFRVQDDAVAEAAPGGTVRALRPGDTALVVSYRGNVRAIRVLVPAPGAPAFRYPAVPEVNYIDREVFAKLRRLHLVPANLAGDAAFLRRVTIDTIGSLPSPEEARSFLADPSPDKRARKIEELLSHPLHAALWATRFSDITGNNTDAQPAGKGPAQVRYSQMWHDWFRKRVAENMPYDQIVRGVLCATTRDGRTPAEWIKEAKATEETMPKEFVDSYAERPSLDLFWRAGRFPPLEVLGERTAAAFLGIRLECAQCHKHPFDRWTQVDYRAHANIFGQVTIGVSPEAQAVFETQVAAANPQLAKAKGKGLGVAEVYIGTKVRSLPHPDADAAIPKVKRKGAALPPPLPLPAKALGGPVIAIEQGRDARVALFDWLRSPDNPYFARSFVNRVWGHYLGVGLVDPVDNFSQANPPTNESLLDALARDFIDHQFDMRHLERTILNARAYQLDSAMNETNQLDRTNYSHSYLRPLMAEAVVDVLNSALGITESFGDDARPGSRAIEVASTRVANPNITYAFRTFGRSTRTAACDCERATEPALSQTLYLMTDAGVLDKLRASYQAPAQKGAPAAKLQTNRLTILLESDKTDDEILEELFLATLTRFPTAAERKHFADYRAARKASIPVPVETPKKGKAPPKPALTQRETVFLDTLWALINTREFITNH
jgi:hypothetical protein